ncbi:MAG: ABC transporter ATP-binding protein [Dehalococcoidia bacterium]|nr:ABC transporter ATP-binding protein [Dehalococcoidia bacterium]MCA9856678.1 ABC transporter ATP-binding protein [Dehalococcoidia bacterium]MCB9483769.1 ABC transporter ATP-binding protein [Dehalococcoidia bacterium]MCB9491986.1 ABC transporter ATP-binding protein [Dehalococcoidia bacterium]
MAASPLRVSGGTRRFGARGQQFTVFEGLDLEVEAGEVFVLLGPSGCGKSTLLRVIAGLDELDEGTVAIAAEEHGRDVGIVFQQPLLLPWLSVRENVTLGLNYDANRSADEPGLVDRTLAEFGLTELADAYPDELSGGQAQRVSLARTVVTRPRVILLDEPFGALDPLTRRNLQQWLLGIQQSLGLTVVMVTHDVEEALLLGNRVALMSPSPGRICRTWELSSESREARPMADLREEVLQTYAEVARLAPGNTSGFAAGL